MPADYSSDEWLRRILAYTTLFGFIGFIFFYGVADSLYGMSNGFHPLQGLNSRTSLTSAQSPAAFCILNFNWKLADRVAIPDFSRYEFLRKLSAEEFPIGIFIEAESFVSSLKCVTQMILHEVLSSRVICMACWNHYSMSPFSSHPPSKSSISAEVYYISIPQQRTCSSTLEISSPEAHMKTPWPF